ncbi:transmembrane protein 225B-like [Notamacropus eugenii]|uniref:transmembrane protein 225B-like n=1 Tax=Notamacropus eugenii TaxID=9315 RepID=UPI003B67CC67
MGKLVCGEKVAPRFRGDLRLRARLSFGRKLAFLAPGREDGNWAEAGAAGALGMDGPREEGCGEIQEECKVLEVDSPEKRKFIYSVPELKDLCWVGTLAFNLMGSLMVTWATISPHWTQLSYSNRIMYSSLWENCAEGSCWKPGDSAGYMIYGRCFLVFAVVFSLFLNIMLLGLFFQFCSPIPQEGLIFAILDTITGIAAFIGLLMHMLQMKSLRGPKVIFLWPYFIVFISCMLFLYSAILFIFIHKEFFQTKCLRSSRVIPNNPDLEREKVVLESTECVF